MKDIRDLTGARVLLLLRDHVANDLQGLCKYFGLDSPTYWVWLENILRELEQAGLITHSSAASSNDPYSGRIEVTERWPSIQHALGISLKKVAQLGSDSLVVTPQFGVPTPSAQSLDVFVVMSFDPKLKPIYDNHILKVTKSLNLTTQRADDIFSTHHVMSDVWQAMNAARVIIADCTGRNPNVFYEIGMAHTLGRPVILLAQRTHDVPFDVKDIRYIQYEYTPPGMERFESQLAMTLTNELQSPERQQAAPQP